MRGQTAELGAKRIAQNGYEYTKVEVNGKPTWRLSHHLVAEEILGRPLNDDERVSFIGSRKDLSPENIRVTLKGQTSVSRRLAQIEARISELEAERDHLRSQL